ncbi:Pyruvate:ferredoxin oxidoreductase and related 2-oxoacid:ferredoxin oxidoreductases, alpha subunit [Desulfurococcus amylolyticus 1221n]|uniref:2-oxoacid oxidoreductase (ferredoxin) n=1 Tax=Desulfurococcus amylolyticus (strain DSM 18924 / JCM 16383 / VKM B-2413 / 1221n) TaxID=490899 RepID=B8D5Y2_DESA1|nr:Pyruvate:ferredoxin oxidoreductase and related 2-oxoacid:ferredoxin oxidoreductases, alpha subunit [Desulfurococcus amylolyticus 1221n]
MGMKKALTGNYAVSYAVKLARPDVIAAYPITPQTSIVEKLSEMIENGELDSVMIRVESEHSALAACFGAAVAGARVFTATSSQGLLYMHEVVHWASRARIPMVMAIVSRTINAPWNIWPDHSDFMDQRDAGWVMSYAMDNQEALDLVLQAFKISEDPSVYLPVMVGLEGFILGHTTMPVDIPDESMVREWLGPRRQGYIIDGSTPLAVGGLTMPEDTEYIFYGIQEAMNEAKKVIKEVTNEYNKLFGRKYSGLIECFHCSDAKYITISIGAWSGDLMEAVEKLRNEGYPIGSIRIRYYRPFPMEDIWEVIRSSKGVLVYDRSISFGSYGPIFTDLAGGLLTYTRNPPYVSNIVAGIAGVNVTAEDFYKLTKEFIDEVEKNGQPPGFKWVMIRR